MFLQDREDTDWARVGQFWFFRGPIARSLLLAGCATSTDITVVDKPDTRIVTASATGCQLAEACA